MKEAKFPKLAKREKYEHWFKRVEKYQKEMERSFDGDNSGMEELSVRKMKETLQDSQHEEIQ